MQGTPKAGALHPRTMTWRDRGELQRTSLGELIACLLHSDGACEWRGGQYGGRAAVLSAETDQLRSLRSFRVAYEQGQQRSAGVQSGSRPSPLQEEAVDTPVGHTASPQVKGGS